MKKIITIILLFIANISNAQLKLARLFSDHVVLQRQKVIPIWGWDEPNKKIAITLGPNTVNTISDVNGNWKTTLPAMEAGGPYELTISDENNKIAINDVLLGEVWLLSGQSNMEWKVKTAKEYEKEKKDANYPKIRQFYVDHEVTMTPQTDLKSGDWKISSEETFGDFSAIGFFFAKEIFQKTNVPIGLIHSSWGGSQIEGWISKEAMLTSPELGNYAKNMPSNWLEADAIQDKKLRIQLFGNGNINPSLDDESKYIKAGYDFNNWHTVQSPLGSWDWKGIWAFRGNGFLAKAVEISQSMVSKKSTMGLGILENRNQIFINGKLIADTTISGRRTYNIPANTWKVGQNQIIIKISNGHDINISGSMADFYIANESSKIDIAENWKIMPSFAENHEYKHSSNNVGTTIYNSMIAPIIPFSLRGCLWYQGESNAERAFQYRTSFPLMINDWRKRWNDEFSFYWVQLSSYGAYQNSNQGSKWAELREAQSMTLKLPKTGQAITIDIGNPTDIHPTNKQDVGHRLAALALKNDYNNANLIAEGPQFESIKYKKGKAIISFKNTGASLISKDKFGYLKGFEIAGDDKVFNYAKANIIDQKVEVEYNKKKKPTAVRYAWADSPIDANLYNTEGFPANSFRTDNWNNVTIGKKFE